MITDDDLKYHKAFLMIFNEGKFQIQGEALNKVTSLKNWYVGLGGKLEMLKNEADQKRKIENMKQLKEKKIKDSK